MKFARSLGVVLFLSCLAAFRSHATEPTAVAVMPESLHRATALGHEKIGRGGVLADQVRLVLGTDDRWSFVERADLSSLEREHALSAAGGLSDAAAIQSGRLGQAEWVLSIRLLAIDLTRPAVVIEVFDTLRAERIASVEAPLDAIPDESWLISPTLEAATSVADVARHALTAARSRTEALKGRLVFAPIGFINVSRTDRLEPLDAALRSAISALETSPGARFRVLPLDTVADTFEESLLMQAGMSELGPDGWGRFADAFVWVEFAELPPLPGTTVSRAKVDLTISAHGGVTEIVHVHGMIDALPELASRAAGLLATKLGKSGSEGFTSDTRSALARRLIAAARTEDPHPKPWHTPQQQRRFVRAARLVELAAFFSPETREWRELHVWMARQSDSGNTSHAYWADRFWQTVDHFILTPDGSVDVGLLGRGATYRILVPGSTERFLRIGRALGDGKLPPAHKLEAFARNFMNELQQAPDLPRQIDVFEAMWPVLRQALENPRDYDRIIMENIYRGAPQRGRAFITREFLPTATDKIVASANPWFEFIKPGAPSSSRTAVAPGVRQSVRRGAAAASEFHIPLFAMKNNRLVEAPHASLDELAELPTRFLEFEPFRMATDPFDHDASITRVAAGSDGLWAIIRNASSFAAGVRSRPLFFDLERHEASPRTSFGELTTSSGDVSLTDGHVWLATAGQGLRILDQRAGGLRTVDSSRGLLRDEVLRVELGLDAAFADSDTGKGTGEFLSRVPFRDAPVARAVLDTTKALDGLPPALRAAIASFGPNAQPRVKLPPLLGKSTWSKPSVSGPESRPLRPLRPDGDFTTHCRTAAGDGFWISDGTSVAWAAGDQLKPIARWGLPRVQALADDGRNLFVAVTLQEFPTRESRQPPLMPDALRIYVYDHQTAIWRGYFRGGDYFESMSATRGLLAFTSPDTFTGKRTLLLMNTSVVSPPADVNARPSSRRDLFSLIRLGDVAAVRAALAAGADVNEATTTGWTPLMAALWAESPGLVRLLLEAGARVDVVDNRGWHPLLIASAWSSLTCLEPLLATGISPDFQTPSPAANDPRRPHAPRLTALNAALRSGRADSVAALLRAGANPDLANETGASPRTFAAPSASAPLPSRVADFATLNLQLAQVNLSQREPTYIETIKPLLAAGADPLWTPSEGEAVILKALNRRFFAAAELMLDHAGDLNRVFATSPRRNSSRTIGMALFRGALQNEQIAFANRLLDKGLVAAVADDGQTGSSRPPLLHVAVEKGDARIVRALLTSGFRFSSIINDTHRSLTRAIERKDAALLVALLEPVPLKDGRQSVVISTYTNRRDSYNLLFAAIHAEWEEGIRLLVRAGARRDAHNAVRQTLSQIVRTKPALAVVFNDRPGAPDNTLEGATAHHSVADRQATLAHTEITPAVVAYRDHDGETLLMAAARRGDGTLVRRLLSAGSDPKAAMTGGATALSLGILTCDEDTIAVLLAAGASPDGAPGSESPPLHVAAFGGSAARVAQLLAAGASPILRTPRDGMSPVLSAAASPHELATLVTLMKTGRIDLTVANQKGLGVLELAVTSDSPEKIQYLLDQGAHWQKTQGADYHPMDVAASNGLTGSLRKLAALGLHSPRAFSLAKDDATRAILLSDASTEARLTRDNETLWPDILRDAQNWRARAEAHLETGGDVNHQSEKWGDPLTVAMWRDHPQMVKFLLDRGADPIRTSASFAPTTARTVFFGWILQLPGRPFTAPPEARKTPEALDEIALAYLDFFWEAESHDDARSSMLRAAFEARLPRTAARMIELGAPARSAINSFRKATGLTPEERSRWAKILAVKTPAP